MQRQYTADDWQKPTSDEILSASMNYATQYSSGKHMSIFCVCL